MRPETTEDRPQADRRSAADFTLIRPLSNRPNPGNLPYFSGKHAGICRDLPAQ